MAGYTPFHFSSRATQQRVKDQNGDFSGMLGNLGSISNTINGIQANNTDELPWYEMWINPDKVNLDYKYLQKQQHTAGALVTFHYRQDVVQLKVDGYSGWILNPSANIAGQEKENWIQSLGKGDFGRAGESYIDAQKRQLGITNTKKMPDVRVSIGKQFGAARTSRSNNNSARLFISRLKAIADEPMYYLDEKGIEHYNTKYIKMYTKQFPNGVIAEGYYTSFAIPESAQDHQTISYNFSYIIERLQPIQQRNRIVTKFAGNTLEGNWLRGFYDG